MTGVRAAAPHPSSADRSRRGPSAGLSVSCVLWAIASTAGTERLPLNGAVRQVCNPQCIEFVQDAISGEDLSSTDVLEVGSCDINGSVRSVVEPEGPATYVGIDVVTGPGVDVVCKVEHLRERFGNDRFDVVICTEVLEHVLDWRSAVGNMKSVLRPGGLLLLTTRAYPFHYHPYPRDHWRFDLDDMRAIFADMRIVLVTWEEPLHHGVHVACRKLDSTDAPDNGLDDLALWSVVTGQRELRPGRQYRVRSTLKATQVRMRRLFARLVKRNSTAPAST